MSEDNLTIRFTTENLRNKKHRTELEKIYETYIPKDEGDESSIKYSGNKATYFRAFFSADHSTLSSLLSELEKKGGSDLIATVWCDTVGEEALYIWREGKLLEFESTEDMEEYLKESVKGNLNFTVNYGKSTKKNTLLIRLHIKAKGKRKKLFELFNMTLDPKLHCSFKEKFKSLIISNNLNIEWCRFRGKGDETWDEVCSEDLLPAITDVIEIDEYLLLAFDLDKLLVEHTPEIDRFIYFVFIYLDGVRKLWVKWRPKGYDDFYLYYPGMGDESMFLDKEIENDNDWPQFRM